MTSGRLKIIKQKWAHTVTNQWAESATKTIHTFDNSKVENFQMIKEIVGQ